MKAKIYNLFIWLALFVGIDQAAAQGTVFTYQGELNESGQAANGRNYGMVFYLYDAPTNGNLLGNLGIVSVTVSNGLFTVSLDFGNEFNGTPRWLEISVQKNGGAFTQLAPRQQLTPTPYAIFANTASNLSGTLSASQINGAVNPAGGSANYIQNQDSAPQAASFNISGDAIVGGTLTAGGVTVPSPINSSDAANKGYVDAAISTVPIKVPLVSSLPAATSANAGLILFNTTSNTLMVCDGTAWNSVGQRHVFYTTGNSAVGWTTVSATPVAISGRTLSFTKSNAASRLRITYSDNLGLNTASAGATWEVKLDGASISPALVMSLYNGGGSGTIMLQPGALAGYATGVAAGPHTLTVYVYAAPGYSNVGTYAGWNSSFLLEVEEIQ